MIFNERFFKKSVIKFDEWGINLDGCNVYVNFPPSPLLDIYVFGEEGGVLGESCIIPAGMVGK